MKEARLKALDFLALPSRLTLLPFLLPLSQLAPIQYHSQSFDIYSISCLYMYVELCNYPLTRSVRLSVGRSVVSVRQSVIISKKGQIYTSMLLSEHLFLKIYIAICIFIR